MPPAPGDGRSVEPWPWLSAQELGWGQALPALRRQQYWRSRAALRQLLAAVLDQPAAQVPLHSPPGAPPWLAGGLGWVSLSHAAGAVLLGWSHQPLGLDLESCDRRFDAASLAQRFFPMAECSQLADLPPEPLRRAVLRSWLAKEAAIKWRQRSLAQELGHWCFDHGSGQLSHQGDGTVLRPVEGAMAGWRWAGVGEGLMAQGPSHRPLIWRFQDEEPCSQP